DPEGRPVTDYDVRVGVPFGGILAAAFEAPAALRADGATPLLPAGTVRLVIESGARIGLHERSDEPVSVVTEVVAGKVTDVPVTVVPRGMVRVDVTRASDDVRVEGFRLTGVT